MQRVLLLSFAFASGVAACAPFPELARAPAATAADYPRIVPLEAIPSAQPSSAAPADAQADADLIARAEALRARAAAARGPVIAPSERQEMLDAAARHR